jgi:hypothetical protein
MDSVEFSYKPRKAPTPTKENHDAEITKNEHDLIDISEPNLNSNVNNTMEKNENLSATPVEPSEPSEPSANLNSNDKDESKRLEWSFPTAPILKPTQKSNINIISLPNIHVNLDIPIRQ